jgi:shikimate kinase
MQDTRVSHQKEREIASNMLNIKNIFLIGPMGSGKSTIGRALAKQLKFDFYDSDEVIETRAGVDIAWIFDVEGESGFRKREQQVIEELTNKNHIVLATGGGAILLPENRAVLASRGVIVYLELSHEQQLARLQGDNKRPLLLESDDVSAKLTQLREQREPIYEELSDITVNTDNLTIKSVVKKIIQLLQKAY